MKFMFSFTISVQKVNFEVKKLIQQGRMAKKMTQADLAKAINEKATVVNDYESGRAVPSQQILAKMERILGVKLRGKKK
jgi:putative transcription factor